MARPNRIEETAALIEFATAKCENTEYPFSIRGMVSEFVKRTETTTPLSTLEDRLVTFRIKIHKNPNLGFNTKVRLLYGLGAPVDEHFLAQLQQNADVLVDEKDRIIKYVARDGSLHLEGKHRNLKKVRRESRTERRRHGEEDYSEYYEHSFQPSPKKAKEDNWDTVGNELRPVFYQEEMDVKPNIRDLIGPSSSALAPSTNLIPEGSVPIGAQKRFLESCQTMIQMMELPINPEVQESIQKTIDRIDEFGDSKTREEQFGPLEISELHNAICLCLNIIKRSEGVRLLHQNQESSSTSRSVQTILLLLRNAILSMRIPQLADIQMTVKRIHDGTAVDKEISVSRIQMALGAVIGIMTS